MRFLTDENVSTLTVEFLRDSGHDVEDVKELGLSGMKDQDILSLSIDKKRIFITLDKDFGQTLRAHPQSHYGIIHLRIKPAIDELINQHLAGFLSQTQSEKILGKLVIISNRSIRVR